MREKVYLCTFYQMEDCCAVCAEPLEWVAYGPCGHKDACSKCVTRLRFVLKDSRCVICQQVSPVVFVTRFLGEYTKTLPARELEELQSGKGRSHYHLLRAVDAYFDDKTHCEEIRKLCSYTHPALLGQADEESQPAHFKNLAALKKALQAHLNLRFCDICLEGRKVFLPEQVLYSRADLVRHQRIGDVEGVMAESGFKGHPSCRFCNLRFFGENELFFHMQQTHEQCHICKKVNPDRFIYFRDYNELEEHFRHEHFLCGHPSCLDKKFVVFPSEQELKQHTAREHAGSMSRAERRQALTIPIDIQYSRRPLEEPRGGRGRLAFRLREPDSHQLATALQQASMDSATRQGAQQGPASRQAGGGGAERGGLDDSDFPSMTGTSFSPFAPAGYGAAAAGNAPRPEDFPALPGTSKAAKRRAKEKEKEQARSLAERIGRQGDVKVLNPGRASSTLRDEAFPALGHSTSAPQLAGSRPGSPAPQWQATSSRAPQPLPARPAAPRTDEFPSLPQTKPPSSQPLSILTAAATAVQSGGAAGSRAGHSRLPRQEDFPSLGAERPAAVPREAFAEAREEVAGPSGRISEGLKAANKALTEKVKRQLDTKHFADFKQEAGRFMRGEIDAKAYHKHVVTLGLSNLIPEMASLLPDTRKRSELLALHEAAPSTSGRWVPPEATAAALRAAKSQGSWQCPHCTVINEPRAAKCEACSSKRPMQDLAALPKPHPLNGISANAEDGAGNEPSMDRKSKRVPKFERLRLTSGGKDPGVQAELDRRTTKPGNVWTQRHALSGESGPPSQAKGAWSSQGKLANEVASIQNAWAKK